MNGYAIESRPQLYARTAGALYLLVIGLGFFAVGVRGKVLAANAAATVSNLRSLEPLWRLGIAAEFVALICVVTLAMIYYYLLKPVNKEINLLATFLRLVAITIQAVAVLDLVSALAPLRSAAYLKAFSPEQLQAMVSLAIHAHSRGFGLALLIFGWCFLFHGYLIYKSTFLPRVLGPMIQIGGLCYLVNSFALFLNPALANRLFPAILLPDFVAEVSLCLWLLIKGVNVQRWHQRAASAEKRDSERW